MSLYFINHFHQRCLITTHTKFLNNSNKIRPAYFCFEVCLGAQVAMNPVTIDSTFPV